MRGFNNPNNNKKPDPIPPKLPTFLPNDRKPTSFKSFTTQHQKPQKFSSAQQQYTHLRQLMAQKQQQLKDKEKMYRIQNKTFKNSSMKDEIQRVDREVEKAKVWIALELIQQNKNNKQSPLFYNENGISPMELTLVDERKHQAGMEESFVCMICFQDIEQNQSLIYLPCEHNFHKDCAIQHFLGSRFCPSCSEMVDLVGNKKGKVGGSVNGV